MILLLDNEDSFVWNLAQALRLLAAEVEVVRGARLDDAHLQRARALVLSPGPGRPESAPALVATVQRWSGRLPILGVCLGHQAIAVAFGGLVDRGEPCHGRTSPILHDGNGLYRGLPSPTAFCRYHSLRVQPPVPMELVVDARLVDGTIMGLRHRDHPTFGVQFHPESFRSEHGAVLLRNFLREAA